MNNKICKKNENEIKYRHAIDSYNFNIYKVVNNKNFYLNRDGNFYTTTTNAVRYSFNTKEELNEYIVNNFTCLIEKYGDIKIRRYVTYICLGYCEKLTSNKTDNFCDENL